MPIKLVHCSLISVPRSVSPLPTAVSICRVSLSSVKEWFCDREVSSCPVRNTDEIVSSKALSALLACEIASKIFPAKENWYPRDS